MNMTVLFKKCTYGLLLIATTIIGGINFCSAGTYTFTGSFYGYSFQGNSYTMNVFNIPVSNIKASQGTLINSLTCQFSNVVYNGFLDNYSLRLQLSSRYKLLNLSSNNMVNYSVQTRSNSSSQSFGSSTTSVSFSNISFTAPANNSSTEYTYVNPIYLTLSSTASKSCNSTNCTISFDYQCVVDSDFFLSSSSSDCSSIQSQLSTCKSDLATATGSVASLTSSLSTCQSNLNACQNSSSSCDYSEYESQISTLSGNLANCEGMYDRLESDYDILSGNYNTCTNELSSCLENGGSFGSGDTQWSSLFINNIQHLGNANIYIEIPEEIERDYNYDEDDTEIEIIGYGYDQEKMQSIVNTQFTPPTSEDLTNAIGKIADFLPLLAIMLLIVYAWWLIKKVF